MNVQLTNKLQLVFYNSMGGTNVLAPKFFSEDLGRDVVKLQEWMGKLSDLNLFHDKGKNMDLYTQKKSARLVETKVTELF